MSDPQALVEQGTEALLEGRFRECERLAGQAARLDPVDPAPAVLATLACREQGRAAEAELMARALLARHPDLHEAHALLGAVLADLGRDGQARRQLDILDTVGYANPAVAALAAETAAALDSAAHAERAYAALARRGASAAGAHGSLARHLGLACHVVGRWDAAADHFERALDANHAAGAPVVLAHARRQYSALLRARGDDGDWERAIDLLAEAAVTYRRLGIERLAEDAEAVLRRSQEPPPSPEPGVFRRTASGWDLRYAGQGAVVPDGPGLADLAALLAAEGRPVHAADLAGGAPGEAFVAACRSRLAVVDRLLGSPAADPVLVALARAERDLLLDDMAAPSTDDAARRLVALRIRTSLDALEATVPALARHLRRSIRTGTCCVYDPGRPERWMMGR